MNIFYYPVVYYNDTKGTITLIFVCVCCAVCYSRMFECSLVCLHVMPRIERIILYEVLHGTRRWLSGGMAHCRSEVTEYSFPPKLFHDIFCLSRLVVSSGRLRVARRTMFQRPYSWNSVTKQNSARVEWGGWGTYFSMPPEFCNNASSRWPHYSFAHLFVHSSIRSFIHSISFISFSILQKSLYSISKRCSSTLWYLNGCQYDGSPTCIKLSKRTMQTGSCDAVG